MTKARKPPAYTDDASCAQVGPGGDIWYPEKGGGTKEAKDTCARCPVVASCLRDALAHEPQHERHGVWGGTSPTEREILTGSRSTYRSTTRAAIIARLATIGVDVEAILADLPGEDVAA